MRNLHRITGAVYEHEKVGLCAVCQHRQPYTDRQGNEWQGYCGAHGKILSAASDKVKKPRCKDFQQAE